MATTGGRSVAGTTAASGNLSSLRSSFGRASSVPTSVTPTTATTGTAGARPLAAPHAVRVFPPAAPKPQLRQQQQRGDTEQNDPKMTIANASDHNDDDGRDGHGDDDDDGDGGGDDKENDENARIAARAEAENARTALRVMSRSQVCQCHCTCMITQHVIPLMFMSSMLLF
jgi:hypothetical protein